MRLICQKLGLMPGMRVLDIGCPWGGLAKYAAEKHGVAVVGITVSKEQVEPGRRMCAGLPVELRLQDYRDVDERFDRVVSVGMFEHVGHKNYRTYTEVVRACLTEDGLFLLHTTGGNRSVTSLDPWMNRYIFPNGMLPSIRTGRNGHRGLVRHGGLAQLQHPCDRTLTEWARNLEKHWTELELTYDERFHRMWRYYLLSCAGAFRARGSQLWQIVLSPRAFPAATGQRARRVVRGQREIVTQSFAPGCTRRALVYDIRMEVQKQ